MVFLGWLSARGTKPKEANMRPHLGVQEWEGWNAVKCLIFPSNLVGGVMLTFSGGEIVSIAHTEFIFSNDNDFWIN